MQAKTGDANIRAVASPKGRFWKLQILDNATTTLNITLTKTSFFKGKFVTEMPLKVTSKQVNSREYVPVVMIIKSIPFRRRIITPCSPFLPT